MTKLLVVGILAFAGVGRLLIPGHGLSAAGSYEAFAHIGVGLLMAIGWPSACEWFIRRIHAHAAELFPFAGLLPFPVRQRACDWLMGMRLPASMDTASTIAAVGLAVITAEETILFFFQQVL